QQAAALGQAVDDQLQRLVMLVMGGVAGILEREVLGAEQVGLVHVEADRHVVRGGRVVGRQDVDTQFGLENPARIIDPEADIRQDAVPVRVRHELITPVGVQDQAALGQLHPAAGGMQGSVDAEIQQAQPAVGGKQAALQ